MNVALDAVNIDCSDAEKLAGFWPAALRRQVRPGATTKHGPDPGERQG
jgi:hypothetical protein